MKSSASKRTLSFRIRLLFAAIVPLLLVSLFLVSLFLAQPVSAESVKSINVSSKDPVPRSRWIFGFGEKPPSKKIFQALARAKKAQESGDYDQCLTNLAIVSKKLVSLEPWLLAARLDCAAKQPASVAMANGLAKAIQQSEKHPEWLTFGPQASLLRQRLLEAHFALIAADMKKNRSRAWRSIDRLQQMRVAMDASQRGKLYRAAGELAFIEQKMEAALEFFQRSVNEVDSSELRERLLTVESMVRKSAKTRVETPIAVNQNLEASPGELAIVERMTTALRSGDLIPAAEDGVKLLKNFPGGTRAKWAADRILEIYWSIAGRTDGKFLHLQKELLKLMEKADGERQFEWARSLFRRGQYADALQLARRSAEQFEGTTQSTKIVDLAAKAAGHIEKNDVARELNQKLIVQHSGTSEAREAMLRAALIDYRTKQYSSAVAHLERLLVLPEAESLEVQVRYWLWRSLQRLDTADRATEQMNLLVAKFPFTYYGLRARVEKDGVLKWSEEKPNEVKVTLWVTPSERASWERLQLLLEAGWLDEAQAEIQSLPPPLRPEDKALRARIWAAAFNYNTALRLLSDAWDTDKSLRKVSFMQVAFPKEFTQVIEEQAAQQNLDRYLLMGLIKQESSYHIRAVSPSPAYGLMQLVPATAKEVAGELKMKNFKVPDDLFRPQENVRLGSFYYAKLLRRYSGHVPLALAAYNAGIGRVDRWLNGRPSLSDLSKLHTSDPDAELWFDELPWKETSHYVKAILRNALLYKLLDKGRVEVKNPFWESPTAPQTTEKNQQVK